MFGIRLKEGIWCLDMRRADKGVGLRWGGDMARKSESSSD